MAEVTVCIPAYRADPFIHHTLASVSDQSYQDFEVEIGIEPVEVESVLLACAPFLEDPRFRAVVNPETLGYGANVRALLRRVRSPLFAVLPHDDGWHPRFLERLRDALRARPDAVIAYPDLLCFAPDGLGAGVIRPDVSDADLPERIISWLLDGASGNIWHGLTRSEVLTREFPDNPYRGFAVECEWALHLLREGRVLHVAEPLYLKRQPTAVTPDSVSASWIVAEEELPAALDHHRRQLLSLIPDALSPGDREAARVAAEAAVLRRHQEFANRRWGLTPRGEQTASELLEVAKRMEPRTGARIIANVRWALSRHWEARGDQEAAERQVREGLLASPDDAFLCTQHGWVLIGRDEIMEALQIGLRASRAHPDDPNVRLLLRNCEDRLERRLRPRPRPSDEPGEPTADDTTEVLAPLAGAHAESDARSRPRRMANYGRGVLVRFGGPNPLFDPAWYRESYPDVPAGPLRPWLHWLRIGWQEGRNPNPLFDTEWYLATNPDVRAAGMDPLAHYLLHGSAEGRDPGPEFAARAYLERYPDVRAAGMEPLLHYRRYGAAEGRIASPRRD